MSERDDQDGTIREYAGLLESLKAAFAASAADRDVNGRCPNCGSWDVVQSWLDESDFECRGCGAWLRLS